MSTRLQIVTKSAKAQYPSLQPVQRKPVRRAIDSHSTEEIVRQYRYTPKGPVQIARDLGRESGSGGRNTESAVWLAGILGGHMEAGMLFYGIYGLVMAAAITLLIMEWRRK